HVKEDKVKGAVCHRTVGLFQSDDDLAKYGYPAITPIRGVDIAAAVRTDECGREDGRICALGPANPPFGKSGDMPFEEAAGHLRKQFPGVNVNAVMLLIAAKGVIQRGDFGEIPQVFIVGQSGSGKSKTATLAAELCGDKAAERRLLRDE